MCSLQSMATRLAPVGGRRGQRGRSRRRRGAIPHPGRADPGAAARRPDGVRAGPARCVTGRMGGGAEPDLARIRELRGRGLTPKQIARAVGLPPAQVTALVRGIAATEVVDPTQQPVAECWVSPGWSAGLTVTGDHGWPVEPAAEETASGLIGVLVAREAGRE